MTSAVANKPKRPAAAHAAVELPEQGPVAILKLAISLGATFEQAQQMVRREEEKAYTAAFAAFSAEAIEIVKKQHASFVNEAGDQADYDYEDLASVIEIVKPFLSRHGLTLSWDPTRTDGLVQVTCTVAHVGGHSKSVTLSAEPEDSGGKNHIQAIGSAVTYLERYTAKAILGLAAKGQDDDGRAGGMRGEEQAPPEQGADPLAAKRTAGHEASKRGMAALTAWWSGLAASERSSLSGPFGNMRRTARAVDMAKGGQP